MCGICGAFPYGGGEPISRHTLEDMLASIRHRGPDDDGALCQRDVALGSRRLSIIDLAGGHQPIANEDGSVVVVFNGEIYNYRELRPQPRARAATRFATASDTEVIVHLYEETATTASHAAARHVRLRALGRRRRRLLLARDRLGIKPLYYARRRRPPRVRLRDQGAAAAPGRCGAARPRRRSTTTSLLKYVPGAADACSQGIQALPPGHVLTCATRRRRRLGAYWDCRFRAATARARRGARTPSELRRAARARRSGCTW